MRKRAILVATILALITISTFFYKGARNPEEVSHEIQTGVLSGSNSAGDPQVRPAIEWLSDEEFAIYRGCGTECEAVYIFDIKENFKQKLYYGVKHTWSPNKKYVLAYHYAIQLGISVGDKFGNTLFSLRREYPKGSERVSTPKAVWSTDSSKLALIINKNKRAELELLVFDVENSFKPLLQKDLESNEFSELEWKNERTISYTVGNEIIEVKVI